jgi:hypothetical protein
MKEGYCQLKKEGWIFMSSDVHDVFTEGFKYNQIANIKAYKIGKGMEPSIDQHNTLFACFDLVLENNDKSYMQTIEGVKEACKVGIDFRDPGFVMVRPDGGIQFKYRSFSFKELPAGRERDIVMQKAFEWCADQLGIHGDSKETGVDKMVKIAKSKMLSR